MGHLNSRYNFKIINTSYVDRTKWKPSKAEKLRHGLTSIYRSTFEPAVSVFQDHPRLNRLTCVLNVRVKAKKKVAFNIVSQKTGYSVIQDVHVVTSTKMAAFCYVAPCTQCDRYWPTFQRGFHSDDPHSKLLSNVCQHSPAYSLQRHSSSLFVPVVFRVYASYIQVHMYVLYLKYSVFIRRNFIRWWAYGSTL